MANPNQNVGDKKKADLPALPLQDVVLFSSGVGYFQRADTIDGDVTVDMHFRAEQVNDILKSLVLFDSNGDVRPVIYTTKDSIARRLKSAGLTLDRNMTLGGLLLQFQGARVSLEMGGDKVEGRILSVTTKNTLVHQIDRTVVQIEIINVFTGTGLRTIPLDQVTEVKLLDARLDRELRESLEILATGLDDQQRSVRLCFTGSNSREVRVGYLHEMPVWKTCYRLVLNEQGDQPGKPYLQGWAIVENTTEEDWNGVRLSLISGRPVSFIQDLYQPLYIPRPVVAPQVIGSPLPQTYGEAIETGQAGTALMDRQSGGQDALAPRASDTSHAMRRMTSARIASAEVEQTGMRVSAEQLAGSVVSQAQGTERGELFEYAIRDRVTLAKQQAAMVPILSEHIEGERLSIYDPRLDTRHALNGFRLNNSTGLHLSGGPITVFQDGIYAGDAQINNVQPGEDRLLSYAVDLQLVPDIKRPTIHQETISISVRSGVLTFIRKLKNEQVFTFRNKADAAKSVLAQYRLPGPEFKIIEPPEFAEKTADEYRFKVEVAGKKTAKLRVVAEQPIIETIALLNADFDLLVNYTRNAQVSEKLRAALEQLVIYKRKITELQSNRAKLEHELGVIDQEQSRIRQNMQQLDRTNALYQQYVKKLTDQEARIEKLRAEVVRLRDAEIAAQKALQEFVSKLTMD
jgi:hypothetical protein